MVAYLKARCHFAFHINPAIVWLATLYSAYGTFFGVAVTSMQI